MDRKTIGVIATVASVLLCACPGVFLCFFGIGTVIGGTSMSLDRSVPRIEPAFGYLFMCLSLIFIAIPIVVGFATLRKQPVKTAPPETPAAEPKPSAPPATPEPPASPEDDEPLPPAS